MFLMFRQNQNPHFKNRLSIFNFHILRKHRSFQTTESSVMVLRTFTFIHPVDNHQRPIKLLRKLIKLIKLSATSRPTCLIIPSRALAYGGVDIFSSERAIHRVPDDNHVSGFMAPMGSGAVQRAVGPLRC